MTNWLGSFEIWLVIMLPVCHLWWAKAIYEQLGYTDDTPIVSLDLHNMLAKHLPSVMSKKATEAQMKAEREAQMKAERLEMAKAGCRALSQIRSEAKAKAAAKAAPKAWSYKYWWYFAAYSQGSHCQSEGRSLEAPKCPLKVPWPVGQSNIQSISFSWFI